MTSQILQITVDTAYMVPGYMVISVIWSISRRDGFSYSKKYWIYGQISDIWSKIWVKLKTKAIEMCVQLS